MMRVLDDPTTCPHGNPIPGSAYQAPATQALAEVGVGKRFAVTRITEELEFIEGLLDYLEGSSVIPGAQGIITASSPDGTTTVEIDSIGGFASERIFVTAA